MTVSSSWREVSSTAPPRDRLQRGDARGVDDALDARVASALPSRREHLRDCCARSRRIAGPEPVVGRDMEEVAHALHRLRHRLASRMSPITTRQSMPSMFVRGLDCAHQDPYVVAARGQRACHRRADKARCAGDEDCDRPSALRRPVKRAAALHRLPDEQHRHADDDFARPLAAATRPGRSPVQARTAASARRSRLPARRLPKE